MDKALFIGLSAAFFTAYSLVASALLTPEQTRIVPITPQGNECVTQGIGENETCIADDPRVRNLSWFGQFIGGVASVISVANDIFADFFQLLTFQAKGLEAASFVTALIFVPLGFINGFIIFSAIRGSS
jgi:hypothetical protein